MKIINLLDKAHLVKLVALRNHDLAPQYVSKLIIPRSLAEAEIFNSIHLCPQWSAYPCLAVAGIVVILYNWKWRASWECGRSFVRCFDRMRQSDENIWQWWGVNATLTCREIIVCGSHFRPCRFDGDEAARMCKIGSGQSSPKSILRNHACVRLSV